MKRKKIFKRIAWLLLFVFVAMNTVAFFHAWKFTHFSGDGVKSKAEKLTTAQKISAMLFGIDNPRPVTKGRPTEDFQVVKLQSNKEIECWYLPLDSAKGTVVLFHGYGGEKSSMLGVARQFMKLGYSTLLVDFMGSGGSEGNQTTIGFHEAAEVVSAYNYVQSKNKGKIYLFGTSMGAVAIMKAVADSALQPAGIMLECPFGSMYKTTCARFDQLGVPSFPMASLLVFWGGVQNGFWAFSHKPTEYAKSIEAPTLLLYGEKDLKVSRGEIDEIFENLQGPKKLVTFPLAGHEDYQRLYQQQWLSAMNTFFDN